MGHGIMFYVNEENSENLKGITNRSKVLNDLLKEYFSSSKIENMTTEQARKRLAYLELKKKHREELEKLEHGE